MDRVKKISEREYKQLEAEFNEWLDSPMGDIMRAYMRKLLQKMQDEWTEISFKLEPTDDLVRIDLVNRYQIAKDLLEMRFADYAEPLYEKINLTE